MTDAKQKKDFLKTKVEHVDIKSFNAIPIIEAYDKMSFSARDLARAGKIMDMMLCDKDCSIILTIAGSTSAAGCMQIYAELVKNKMVDVVVATGASIVDMDFFEALGFRHYQGTSQANDKQLRESYIDRIYDTYIDEEELQHCDLTIKKIADSLKPQPYSSREFIKEMGHYLVKNAKKRDSLVQVAFENNVPIFCPAFSDSSAGFGLVKHQVEKKEKGEKGERGEKGIVTIDSVKDFFELTKIKMSAVHTGLLIIGGGVPKNFAQDTVICAEILGKDVPMHRYAVQITVADARDGACSSSTLKEASSWGKVDTTYEQMVFSEATLSLPLLASYIYHKGSWKNRQRREFNKLFE